MLLKSNGLARSILCFLLLLAINSAFAQKTVTGSVVGKNDNQPLPGASVKVKNSSQGTQTNTQGTFTLNVPSESSVLVISVVGFETIEVPVSGRAAIGAITLAPSNTALNEVVVTGYTSQRKKDLTGAVTVVNVEEMNKQPTGQVANQLQGQAAGVTVIGSGQPGEAPQVRIRGINTFGNNTPLYVIDGVPTQDISTLNPNDIGSMQVLKDAGSASIYGSRASNGVIIITTKNGKSGKVTVSYDAYFGRTNPRSGNVFDILSPQEMAQLKFNALANSGTPVTATTPDALYGGGPVPVLPDYIFPTGAKEGDPRVDPSKYNVNPNYGSAAELNAFYRIVRANKTGTDWFHEIFKPANVMSHNLAISGGSDRGRYLLSFDYFNQDGTLINTYLKRYTIRSNTQFNVTKSIRVGENLAYSIVQAPRIGGITNTLNEGSAIGFAFREQPIIPVYDIKGNYAGSSGPGLGNARNPVAFQQRTKDNRAFGNRLFGNVYADVDLIPGLTVHTSFGGESYATTSRAFAYPEYENSENINTNTYTEGSSYGYNWTWTNTLNYRKVFNEIHTVSLLVGTEAYNSKGSDNTASTQSYFSFDPNFTTLTTGSGTVTHTSNRSIESLWSQIGRLDYNLMDKYLVSATIRRDGSSKFAPKYQYGVFPAVTAAWRLSNENFLKSIPWVRDLKIRAGWGIMGNQFNLPAVNRFYTYVADRNASYYDIAGTNSTIQQGFQTGQIGNPDARWEKDINSNIGVDATLFNGLIDFSADYYKKDITDLLFNPSYPGTAGTGTVPFANVAHTQNTGVDLSLNLHTNITSDLKLNSTVTFTTYKNEILKIADNQTFFFSGGQRRFGTNFVRNQVGGPIGAFYGYKIVGFWNDASEIAAANKLAQGKKTPSAAYQTDVAVGRFRYADTNGDSVITADDRTILGNPNPKFTYGFNLALTYKQFDFSVFLYGSVGNKIWNNVRYWTDFYSSFAGAKSKTALYNSWTPANHNAKAPIQENAGSFSAAGTANSYFIEDGSYMRIKNAMLGYTFKKSILGRYGFESCRIYIQGANLLTLTRYSGLDPEISGNGVTEFGIDEGAYPSERQFLIGINLKF